MNRNILQIAAGELGVTESPSGSNQTGYGRWYGLNGQPWCMMFVQWCFAQAGAPLPFKTASCSALLRWYRENRPQDVVTEPQPGDIVLYNFGHTGILTGTTAKTVTAIEGNTSPGEAGSQSNGGGVYRRTRSRTLVTACIRPTVREEEHMTGKEIYDSLNQYLSRQSVPDWAGKELEEAIRLGITDGKEPMALIPRYQAAIMALRSAKTE